MSGCTLFGKLPWAADYVRIQHVHPAALAFDAWLQASHQALALAGASWPSAPLRFVFAVREADAVLTGVLAPSRDRAGRKFPVAVFATLPGALHARRLVRAPAAFTCFHEQAARMLAEECVDRAQSEHALASLVAPRAADLDASRDASITASALAQALFDEAPARNLVRVAAALARAVCDAGPRPQVLELPCRAPAHLTAWLSLLVSLPGRADASPSLFWRAMDEAPRAWLSLAAPPASLLRAMTQPARRSERLCVLADAPEGADAARLSAALDEASYLLPTDAFFTHLVAAFLRGEAQ
ncbi:MAG: type VI secretion system-associated protein TagF [Polyangiales bacterium]